MADDLEREDRRRRDIASKQFDRLLVRSPDDPVEDWARDLFELAVALRQASCSQAALDAPVEQSTAGAVMGKSMLWNAIQRMPLADLTYHLGHNVKHLAEMRLYWSRVKRQMMLDDTKEDDLDDLVTLDQVAPLTAKSKRTLERYLREGKLPEPDVPGGGGKSHKWFWKNLRPALEKVADRQLPAKFPGSRIV